MQPGACACAEEDVVGFLQSPRALPGAHAKHWSVPCRVRAGGHPAARAPRRTARGGPCPARARAARRARPRPRAWSPACARPRAPRRARRPAAGARPGSRSGCAAGTRSRAQAVGASRGSRQGGVGCNLRAIGSKGAVRGRTRSPSAGEAPPSPGATVALRIAPDCRSSSSLESTRCWITLSLNNTA